MVVHVRQETAATETFLDQYPGFTDLPSWTAKVLLMLEQTVNCTLELALGNSSPRFTFR